MAAANELEDILQGGYELRGLELKGPGPATDTHLFAKVARAALSMANIRDGGQVVVGLDDIDPGALLPGLSPADLATWLDFEQVSQRLANYADPPLRFNVSEVVLSTGAAVAVLQVDEFADIPHLCAKGYEKVLRHGAVYVRPRKGPETSEIASSVDMRDLLELATEKALRRFVETASNAGLSLSPAPYDDGAAAQSFENQRDRAWQ